MTRPTSVLFYGMVLTVTGVWCLVWGLGQIGADAQSPLIGWLAILSGAFSIYAGPGLFLGEDAGRNIGQWIAGIQLAYVNLVASCAILGLVNPSWEGVELGVAGVLGLALRLVLSLGALWALSGSEALAFTTGGHGHDSHGHGGGHGDGSVHA